MKSLRVALAILALQLASVLPAFAQATGAVLAGTIIGDQGAVLPGVTLTVRNSETGVTRSIVSEADGSACRSSTSSGRDNLGGVGSSWVTNALSDAFGRLNAAQNNRQAELAVRFIF